MRSLILIFSLILLTNCTTHSVKLGKKCTKIASDLTYEKSYVWIINKKNIDSFDKKISKENCVLSEDRL